MTAWNLYKVVRSGVKTLLVASALAASATVSAAERPVVVELFTSQSCYSCPPAEAYLGKLASRPGVIALEFHVDYWNDLVYGLAGRWVDVHSRPAHTERQRSYARRLPGGVYTPQMVIDGRAQAVGSRTAEVERAIAAARQSALPGPMVAVAPANDRLSIRISGPAPAREVPVWLARYKRKETTQVRAGENRGKTLANHHVVSALEPIGMWSGGEVALEVAPPDAGDGCAVLVQDTAPGPILGAAACP